MILGFYTVRRLIDAARHANANPDQFPFVHSVHGSSPGPEPRRLHSPTTSESGFSTGLGSRSHSSL